MGLPPATPEASTAGAEGGCVFSLHRLRHEHHFLTEGDGAFTGFTVTMAMTTAGSETPLIPAAVTR